MCACANRVIGLDLGTGVFTFIEYIISSYIVSPWINYMQILNLRLLISITYIVRDYNNNMIIDLISDTL